MSFSFTRFWNLLKLQLVVNRKLYLLGVPSIAGILFGFMLFMSYTEGLRSDSQEFIFVIGLVLSSSVFTSIIFKQFARKDSRTMVVMLPVSVSERMTVAILLTIIVYPLVYTMLALPCLSLANWLDFHWNHNNNALYRPSLQNKAPGLYLVNFFIQSCMLLGAISFRKHVFVKTVVLIGIFAFGINLLSNTMSERVVKNTQPKGFANEHTSFRYSDAVPFAYIDMRSDVTLPVQFDKPVFGPTYRVTLPPAQQYTIWGIMLLLPFFLWYAAALKIREQQV